MAFHLSSSKKNHQLTLTTRVGTDDGEVTVDSWRKTGSKVVTVGLVAWWLGCSSDDSHSDLHSSTSSAGGAPTLASSASISTSTASAGGASPKLPHDASPPGEPITAPVDEAWHWIDVAGSQCADGSPTGIGVNLTNQSDDVLIFLEGGGACWDGASCWGPVETAFYVATGYGSLQFATDPQLPVMFPLQRADAQNPFRDKNLVYVPYCTGDSFAGDNVTSLDYVGIGHPTHFVGYKNVGLYLSRLVATFPNAKRVWLVGDSAGGFGTAFNFGRVQATFEHARVDAIDDSGQPIMPGPGRWDLWKTAWNMQLPYDCADCGSGPGAFLNYYRSKYPESRFGLISFDYDVVISPFMSLSLQDFHNELYMADDQIEANWPNARYFVLPGASHVGMLTPTPALRAFVNSMVSDDPGWASSHP